MKGKEPQRILVFVSEFPPDPGGIGNHGFNLARELADRGAEVHVVTESRGASGEEAEFDRAQSFPIARCQRICPLLTQVARILKFLFAAKNHRPDWIIASGMFPLIVVGLTRWLVGARAMVVVHGSEVNLRSGVARALVRHGLAGFQRIVAVSRFTADLVRGCRGGVAVSVIPNGFDGQRLSGSERLPLDGSPALITVGNVTRRKGQHNVVAALPRILGNYPDAKYHIVGIPSERERVEAEAERLGVAGALVWHGAVSDGRLGGLLGGSDLFVMLSDVDADGDVEGFGIALIEANALGVPALGASGCGIEDAVSDGGSGRLVNPRDPIGICEAVHEILSHHSGYAQRALQWAKQFEWSSIGDRYWDTLLTSD